MYEVTDFLPFIICIWMGWVQGSDCVQPFVALQTCIKANPNAFSSKDMNLENEEKDDEVKKEEVSKKEYSIIPPRWSRESPPASKL